MKINMIFCTNLNNYIGYREKLLYRFSEDLKFFKEKTIDNVLIMGFKTFQEIGKALPNRINIIVVNYKYPLPNNPDIILAKSLEEAYMIANKYKKKVFVIGGGKLYKEAIELTESKYKINKIFVTNVHDTFIGDTQSPLIPIEYSKKILSSCYDINQLDSLEYYLEFSEYKLT